MNALACVLEGELGPADAPGEALEEGKDQMAARWASSALLVVEKRLHKVKGASLLNSLVQALAKVDVLEKVG